jgi:ribosomal protein L11 methyltransferase
LAGLGFESFIDTEQGTDAYVPADSESESEVKALIEMLEGTVSYRREEIPEQNWNAQWEADYDPVCVEKKFRVRAPFHQIDASFEHDILIQPQMSFGTGHHETTWLMLNEMDTIENIALNKMEFQVLKGDVSVIGQSTFGVVLANINKNVLLNDIPHFAKALEPKGYLFLSGFFKTDVDDLVAFAERHQLAKVAVQTKNDWALIKLVKS